MNDDHTKILLLVAFAGLVLILVSNVRERVTAETPIDGIDKVGESQTGEAFVTPAFAANVPAMVPPPLTLMMPNVGGTPTVANS